MSIEIFYRYILKFVFLYLYTFNKFDLFLRLGLLLKLINFIKNVLEQVRNKYFDILIYNFYRSEYDRGVNTFSPEGRLF